MHIATDAVQGLGRAGYSSNHRVERSFRDAKLTQTYEGTN